MSYNFYQHLLWSFPCVYEKGYTIYLEGDTAEKIGYIIEGTVQLVHYSESGEVSILKELTKGDTFGDMLILSSNPQYIGALVTASKTRVKYLTKLELLNALKDDTFKFKYIQSISDKALLFNKQVKLLKQATLKEKFLFYLEMKTQETKSQTIKIDSITKLATYMNVQRPSLSRVIRELLHSGVIGRNNNLYWIK